MLLQLATIFHFLPVMVDWEFVIPYQQQYLPSKIQIYAIKCNIYYIFNHMDHLSNSKLHRELNQEIEIQCQNHLKSVLPTFDDNKKRAVQ